jgi:uncharacterized membrane protein
MEWLIIIGLAGWCFYQERRLGVLERQVTVLRAFGRPGRVAAPAGDVSAPEPRPAPAIPEYRSPAFQPDTFEPVEPRPRPEIFQRPQDPPPPPSQPKPRLTPQARPVAPQRSLEAWLSENGLAWIGGGALVIGGALLVGFAAQQGLFTPAVRLTLAALLGAALLAAGEGMRRGRLSRFAQHPLAALIASGAGAAVLYGDAWAMHALYNYIPAGLSALLLAAIAGGLLTLALARGQPLALLALGGAFAAPLVAAGGDWSAPVMIAYLGLLIAVGLVVAVRRNWRACGWAAFMGAGVWALLALVEGNGLKVLALGLEPLVVLAVLARMNRDTAARTLGEIAVVFASVLSWAGLMLVLDHGRNGQTMANLAVLLTPALTALAVRDRTVRPAFMAAPAAALVIAAGLGVTGSEAGRLMLYPVWLIQGVAMSVAALWAVWTRGPRAVALGSAGVALVALGAMAGLALGHGPAGAGITLVAALVASCVLAMLTRAPGAKDDVVAAELLSGSAAAALLVAVGLGASWLWAPVAFALAMLGLAAVHLRFGWRSLAGLASVAGVIAFGALFSQPLWRLAFSGLAGACGALGSALFLALAAWAAARLVRGRGEAPNLADGVLTLVPLAALSGLFIFLRWAASGPAGQAIDPLTEAAIRTLLLGVTGLAGARALSERSGLLAKARVHGILALGLLHGLILQGLAMNPWWGLSGHRVHGFAPVDSLALAFLAPGLIYAAVTWRSGLQGAARQVYGWFGALLLMLWGVLEVRSLAHGGVLQGGAMSIGATEAAGYVLLWLVAGHIAARLRKPPADVGVHTVAATSAFTGVDLLQWWGLGFGLVMLGLWSNPWGGIAARPFSGAFDAGLGWTGYAAAVALMALQSRQARREGRQALGDAAEGAAVLLGLALAALLVRWGFRGDNMLVGQARMEGEIWTLSAVAALLGVALLAAGRLGRYLSRYGLILLLATAVKVLVFDMAHLSGMVRVASFLAVGVLMLTAALTARRMRQRPPS